MTTDDADARAKLIPSESEVSGDAPSARAKPLPRRLPLVPPPTTLEPTQPVLAPARRQRIEQRFTSNGRAGITASFGVADFSPDTATARTLIEAADAAMYESKHAGRNRVARSQRPLVPLELSAATTSLS